jgi:hypothetical protein
VIGKTCSVELVEVMGAVQNLRTTTYVGAKQGCAAGLATEARQPTSYC